MDPISFGLQNNPALQQTVRPAAIENPAASGTADFRLHMRTSAAPENGASPNVSMAQPAASADWAQSYYQRIQPPAGAEFQALIDRARASKSPFEMVDIRREAIPALRATAPNDAAFQRTVDLVELQGLVQDAGVGIELVSKTVEQATDGAKTVLQTQA